MIYEHVRKICDHFYFVLVVRRFVLKCTKHDRKFKHKKHDVLKTAAGLGFKSYSTSGLALPILSNSVGRNPI
jgi:hypothetical protein